jgi:hypothetical protein
VGKIFSHEFSKTSHHEELGKTPIIKMQQVFHSKSIFNELELVMEITTSSKSPH